MAERVPNPEINQTDCCFAREHEAFDALEYVRLSKRPVVVKKKRGIVRGTARVVFVAVRALVRTLAKPATDTGYAPSWWAAIMLIAIVSAFLIANADSAALMGLMK